jgi:hypothetical protein
MFDAKTEQLLRSAPPVPGLDPADIPALLTRHYARLVSLRLRGDDTTADEDQEWTLDRIADTYELIASIHTDEDLRRSSAFVAATAQQILARRTAEAPAQEAASVPNIDRDRVDPALAAAVLFLAAEQYADANEAASAVRIVRDGQSYESSILAEDIVALARGQLRQILERAGRWRRERSGLDLEERALAALLEGLICGIELLAARFLNTPPPEACSGRFDGAAHAFSKVLDLSASIDRSYAGDFGGEVVFAYPGPHHLASLLLVAEGGIGGAALTNVPPPDGADAAFWDNWLRYRAEKFPFVWPNHREALARDFYQTGKSAVVVLPTGAGKTTVSSLKIAGVLARGRKVIFLAPTHALVEQLTEDLQEMFPKDLLGSAVSSDFDLLFQSGAQLQEIEVMTPERCLAMLSFAPEAFSEVGLLVFDECHLLSPQSGKIRRAIDSMLCVLGFHHVAPEADTLFLSAMLKNGHEFGEWIGQLTGRPCVSVDLLWKPSRQARGVVIYREDELERALKAAGTAQAAGDRVEGKPAKGLRKAAASKLALRPWAVWGLQHNWAGAKRGRMIRNRLLNDAVPLAGEVKGGYVRAKPNSNKVAARLAVAAAKNGLKSIVFVNTKRDAVTTAREIAEQIGEPIAANDAETERWEALAAELGDLRHAYLPQPAVAVPHNSLMLRLERDLAERMFRRVDGASVIVATPTLAQGLNLPAHLAVLAGDKRASANRDGREDLEAHEILNAAARAGRAGHLANGVVLLVPEPIITFVKDGPPPKKLTDKLKLVLPEDDHCVTISDPLEVVLDRLMEGRDADADVRYVINRMAAFGETVEEEPSRLFDLRRSYGAFAARKRQEEHRFAAKIDALTAAISGEDQEKPDAASALLASQSGLSIDLLLRLKERIGAHAGRLPLTVEAWLLWTVDWLSEDDDAREALLSDITSSIKGACGAKKIGDVTADDLRFLQPGLLDWIHGEPIATIEKSLGGNPDDRKSDTRQTCPRARELVGSVVPRGFSFIVGLVAHIVEEVDPFDVQEELSHALVESLGTAVRKGLDSPELVAFATENKAILSRVQLHRRWIDDLF